LEKRVWSQSEKSLDPKIEERSSKEAESSVPTALQNSEAAETQRLLELVRLVHIYLVEGAKWVPGFVQQHW
jgi:hypothetical protein